MKVFLCLAVVGSLFSLGVVGCAEKASTTEETTLSTPGGTTTVKVEKEVTTTGENPPAPAR
jgi:hypothetical protein